MINYKYYPQDTPKEKPFPKLMQLKKGGGVFIFRNDYSCTCLVEPSEADCAWSVGEFNSSDVDADKFIDYNNELTLINL